MFVLFYRLMQTITRRSALYITLVAFICIITGAVLFSHFEHESIWTALYWSITTATTVGYGDVSPVNTAGRIIAIGLMITSIPLFGAVFSTLAGSIVEARFRRLMGMELFGPLKNHVLILGDSDERLTVIDSLKTKRHIVVVSEDVDPTTLPSGVSCIKGDPRDLLVLSKVKPSQAKHALIIGSRDGDILEIAIALKELAPNLSVTVSTKSMLASRALKAIGITNTLVWQELLGHTLAKSLQAPHAADLLMQMVNSEEFIIQEIPVAEEFIGKSLSELKSSYVGYVLGLVQGDDVILGVRRNPIIRNGAQLLILKEQ